MKPPSRTADDAVYADRNAPPTEPQVVGLMAQPEYERVEALHAWLKALHPEVTNEWLFSSTSGWYQVCTFERRRLCYFLPRRGDFKLNIVLGDAAIVSLAESPVAPTIVRMLKTARRYPEGTLFSFDRQSLDDELVRALLQAKIEH